MSGEEYNCVLGDKEFETEEEAIQHTVEDVTENYTDDLEEEGISVEDIRSALNKDGEFEFINWSGNKYKYTIEEV